MRPREKAAAATRALLVDTARRLFVEHGYEGVTVRMVAKAAGTSTGAIFGIWEGKAHLFFEVMGRVPMTDAMGNMAMAALAQYNPGQANHLQDQIARMAGWARVNAPS